MSKKLIFGLMLAFIGVFGFQYNASAMCEVKNSMAANDPDSCRNLDGIMNKNQVEKLGENCLVAECVGIGNSSRPNSAFAVYSCQACPDGHTQKEVYPINDDTCDGYLGQSFYTCVPECPNDVDCPDGYKDGGSTFDSCNTTKENSCFQTCSEKCSGNDTASCPENATCSYNTGSYIPGKKYYGSSCNASGKCPVSTITCDAGYYKNGNTCKQCPLADSIYTNSARTSAYQARYTSAAGATSVNDCYLPSETTYYDAKGTFTFNTTCNYE